MPRAGKADSHGAISAAIAQGLPTVVLAGRVNAGKSTLFNRIAAGARAITSAIPGTTRDLNFARASYDDRDFILIDSGGLEIGGRERMSERVVRETLAAVGVADVVVMLFDGRAGFTDADREALALIRETGCPLIVAVNKIDQPNQETAASDFYASGAEQIFFLSAAHGNGVGELLDEVVARLPVKEAVAAERPDLKIALIGRPNVGKSSLLNRLSGIERSIVDSTPGTTRDAIDVALQYRDKHLMLIDTAGIRRKPRVEGELEQASVGRAIEVIRRAEVLLLVIDASEGITDQDAKLAHLVDTNDRAMVIVCNKWDAAAKDGGKVAAFVRDAHHRFPFLEYATMVFTSALTGDGVSDIIPAALDAGESWRATFQTSRLNQILAQAGAAMDPPIIDRRRLNLMYVTQVSSSPPRLAFFANLDRNIPAHYIRFLETRFRKALNIVGSPLRLQFRRTGRDEQRRSHGKIGERNPRGRYP
ncbi:MAG TPA: ribosome biogenesis GTPase Der [Candidatus Binataceae bacterium]|nr:ribosome biogenesis GTPase Der [Candidatus Binataceae bacterium]